MLNLFDRLSAPSPLMTLILDRQEHGIVTGNGLSVATGVLCVAGVSPYYSPRLGRLIWRLRHPDMLARSFGLFKNTVILDDHPEALQEIYPREMVVGGVGEAKWDPKIMQISGDMMLYDFKAVSENKYFSQGIIAQCEQQAGTWDGINYDEVIDIREVNHIASTAHPRQGDRLRLLLDSEASGGEYAVDPQSLRIVLHSIGIKDPQKTEPLADGVTISEIDTDPIVQITDEGPLTMTPEDLAAIESVMTGLINDLISPLQTAIDAMGASIQKMIEESGAEDAPPVNADLVGLDTMSSGVLMDALAIQAAALPLSILCDGLADITTWDSIVGAIELAVGLGEDWDPSGLSISQRLATCKAVSARSSVILDSSDEETSVQPTEKPEPPPAPKVQLPSVVPTPRTQLRFI